MFGGDLHQGLERILQSGEHAAVALADAELLVVTGDQRLAAPAGAMGLAVSLTHA